MFNGIENSTPSLFSARLNPLVVGEITACGEPGSEVKKRMVRLEVHR